MKKLLILMLVLLSVGTFVFASGQNESDVFPAGKQVTIVVPYSAGGQVI